MSDPDKAIRDQMDTWARSDRDDTAALAADRYDSALRGVLAWARGLESTVPASDPAAQIPADLRRIISESLGVSGEDRSEPTPARRWRRGDTPAHPDKVARIAKLVLTKRFAANSFVMRHLHLRYSETEACLNILETWGVVGPREGSKARDVLIPETEADALVQALSEVVTPEGPA